MGGGGVGEGLDEAAWGEVRVRVRVWKGRGVEEAGLRSGDQIRVRDLGGEVGGESGDEEARFGEVGEDLERGSSHGLEEARVKPIKRKRNLELRGFLVDRWERNHA